MTIYKRLTILTIALVAVNFALGSAQARAANGVCPSGTNVFGTVSAVHGKTLLVKTIGAHGFETIRTDDATIHYDGLTLRPGIFVGAFGCFTPDFRRFDASELTLSTDAADYPSRRHSETLTGVVRSIGGGKILAETGSPHGFVTIMTSDTTQVKPGDRIRVTGSFNPDGTFLASRVEDLSENHPSVSQTGVCPSATSLFGRVSEVHGRTLLVKTSGAHGFESIRTDDATIHYNGITLRPGIFVGAYGCFTPNFRRFDASEVTLSKDAADYPSKHHAETLTGVVRSIGTGTLLVETGRPHGYVTIGTSSTARFKIGDRIQATGSFSPDETFLATTIEIKS